MPTLDPSDITMRDPAVIARLLRHWNVLYERYFRCELEGAEHLPTGPAIYFGNHCGSTWTVEGGLLACAIFRERGPDHPLYFLVHEGLLAIPPIGRRLLRVGAVLGSRPVARKVLHEAGQFVVFPGGDLDSHKPFSDRHEVSFHGHTGFIRMAMEERAPLVPFAHVGTHETLFVLASGRRIARALGLPERMRLNVFPLIVSFPFGFTLGPWFAALPLPAKVEMRVLEPVRLWQLGWTDPSDDTHVRASLSYLEDLVREAVGELAAKRKRVFFG